MLYIVSICAVSVLALTGLFALLWDARKIFCKKIPLCVLLHSRDFGNEIEYCIRSLYVCCPNIRVIVADDGGDTDVSKALAMLSRYYSSLFVIGV